MFGCLLCFPSGALRARRVSSAASRLPGITSLRFALHGWQRKGLQPKTIEAYSRAIRRIGEYFNHEIDDLSKQQLLDYFTDLLATDSWSAVKLDLYGLKFYYTHVLEKTWVNVDLIKPPKAQRLPDIVTVEEAKHLFMTTHKLSYRVFYFTLYSLGLRLGEGLRLQVGDIDAVRQRVHIRDSKGNKDRLVPLPDATRDVLRRFWSIHRNPVLLFPNRHLGRRGAQEATTPLVHIPHQRDRPFRANMTTDSVST